MANHAMLAQMTPLNSQALVDLAARLRSSAGSQLFIDLIPGVLFSGFLGTIMARMAPDIKLAQAITQGALLGIAGAALIHPFLVWLLLNRELANATWLIKYANLAEKALSARAYELIPDLGKLRNRYGIVVRTLPRLDDPVERVMQLAATFSDSCKSLGARLSDGLNIGIVLGLSLLGILIGLSGITDIEYAGTERILSLLVLPAISSSAAALIATVQMAAYIALAQCLETLMDEHSELDVEALIAGTTEQDITLS